MKPTKSSPNAIQDLDAHVLWLEKDNPNAAKRFLMAFEETCDLLSSNPQIGSKRYSDHSTLKNLRHILLKSFKNYMIFYIEYPSYIHILRMLHTARDIPTLLESN